MNIELIAIGDEVLAGFVANTNAAFISQTLLNEGFVVTRHSVLPDDPDTMKKGLQEALQRSDLVLTTGGLGPTCDDLTRKVVAELFQSDFRFDAEIAADIIKRFGSQCESAIKDQATVPAKALLIKNTTGTAPGLIFHEKDSTIILMPGVPQEMKAMLTGPVIDFLKKTFPRDEKCYYKRLYMYNLAEAEVDPLLRQLQQQYPAVHCGIYPGQKLLGVHLSVTAKSHDSAMQILDPPFQALVQQFGDHLFEAPAGRIELAVHDMLVQKGATLSAAESCTGGSFAVRLTQIPGASKYFLGSLVVYSNEMKTQLLGVSEKTLKAHGAVSKETVQEMLQGLFEKTDCDYGVAVTGIAGPTGGSPEKPIGTVWCAVGTRRSEPRIWKMFGYGSREMIIEQSVNSLLAELYMILKK